MSTENTFKDPRLLEALEYLDKKYIAEVFDDLKVPDMSEYVPGKRTPLKLWKQFAALAACLILLSFAAPALSKVVEVVSSFAAGWGSGTTVESSDMLTLSDSEINADSLTESPNTTPEIPTTLLITPPDPDYLMFISELEPITQQEMLAVNNAWSVVVYNNMYQLVYSRNIKFMSEEEAAKIADERAAQSSAESSYMFFNYWCFSNYGYIGKFADYIILLHLDKDGVDDEDMVIGTYNTGDHRWYAYKNGVIYSLKDIYECGYITDEQLDIIANRMEQYLVASYNYYPSDYEKNKEK